VVLVRLTEAGRWVLGEIRETRSQALRAWPALLGGEDRAALARALPARRQPAADATYPVSTSAAGQDRQIVQAATAAEAGPHRARMCCLLAVDASPAPGRRRGGHPDRRGGDRPSRPA
jgi:hypothetical protein